MEQLKAALKPFSNLYLEVCESDPATVMVQSLVRGQVIRMHPIKIEELKNAHDAYVALSETVFVDDMLSNGAVVRRYRQGDKEWCELLPDRDVAIDT